MSSSVQAQPQRGPWLMGPGPDLVWGCGLGYLAFFPLLLLVLWLTRIELGAGWLILTGVVTLLTNSPHYGATLLRVYERAEDRRRYALFATWISLLIWAAFVVATREAWVGSLLATLYLTWAPWHFGAQNYGLALMFLGRGGTRVDPLSKRMLHLSIVLSFLLAFFTAHSATPTIGLNGLPEDGPNVLYRFLSLGIPDPITALALPLTGVAYALATAIAFARLARRAPSWLALLPAALLMLLQAAWFSIPALIHWATPAWDAQLTFHVFWFAVAHSVQYLWVTTYYARRSEPSQGAGGFLLKCALAGIGITTFPALLFAPGLLGRVPADAGLLFLVFSTVNVHHFMLDGVVWKLRDGRVARVLLRSSPAGERAAPLEAGRGWNPWRGLAWAVGGVSIAASVAGILLQHQYQRALSSPEPARLERAVEGLTWIGRESAQARVNLARRLAREGELDRARREARRSLELMPSAEAWSTLGWIEAQQGDLEAARRAYAAGLALAPEDKALTLWLASTWAALERPERAVALLEEASSRWPRDGQLRRALLMARHGRLSPERLEGLEGLDGGDLRLSSQGY